MDRTHRFRSYRLRLEANVRRSVTVALVFCSACSKTERAAHPPPQIFVQPANQTVSLGQSATFSVSASGTGLTFAWQKNGIPISGALSSSYQTPPAAHGDGGATFRVVVKDGNGGSATSTSAILTVQGFTPTGSMAAKRYAASATLLLNGKVLILGGMSVAGGASLSSAELYDPAAGAFSGAGTMNRGRAGHTATRLPDGKVLIAGGYENPESLADVELYDPTAGTFAATGSMATARQGHSATLLTNGKVLIAGGTYHGGSVCCDAGDAELYDPATGNFAAAGNMVVARQGHTATLLPSGQVLIAGGQSFTAGILASAELYDAAHATFTSTGDMAVGREGHAAIALPNGNVLVVGGSPFSGALAEAELYDPQARRFTPTGSMTTGRISFAFALLQNGLALVAGGIAASSEGFASAELYDPATGRFGMTGAMSATRTYPAAGALPDGRVLVAGGYSAVAFEGSLNTAEIFDPTANP